MISELRGLAKACGLEPAGTIVQNTDHVTHATYLGSGKVVELRREVEARDADIVLFNEALTPMQMRNLEKELDTEVLDRTGLILQIFASRARTREAKLQVELAQLGYRLPRLTGKGVELSRQAGSAGTVFNRGPGETYDANSTVEFAEAMRQGLDRGIVIADWQYTFLTMISRSAFSLNSGTSGSSDS